MAMWVSLSFLNLPRNKNTFSFGSKKACVCLSVNVDMDQFGDGDLDNVNSKELGPISFSFVYFSKSVSILFPSFLQRLFKDVKIGSTFSTFFSLSINVS